MRTTDTVEPVTYDYREAALAGYKGILQDKKHPDGTIEVILTGELPLLDERVLLTVTQKEQDVQTAWRVVTTIDTSNHGQKAARLTLRLEGIIIED